MGTFRGTGANPDRKEDIVKNQTELLLTTDEELRQGLGAGVGGKTGQGSEWGSGRRGVAHCLRGASGSQLSC